MILKSISQVALATLALCAGAAQAVTMVPVELTTNGGFEAGTLDGWTVFQQGSQTFGVDSTNPKTGGFAGFAGAVGSAAGATMKQANVNLAGAPVVAGEMVTFSVDLRASIPDGTGGVVYGPKLFSELSGGGVSGTLAINNGNPLFELSDGQWHSYTMTGNLGPDVSGGITLQITIANGATGSPLTSTVWVDNASVMVMRPVPEPETYALMLAGLVGVGAMVRRRRAV